MDPVDEPQHAAQEAERRVRSLLLGAGSARDRKIRIEGDPAGWDDLVTLDNNPGHGVDVVHDLNVHPLPFGDNEFDEIHAYEVLEHLASLGDWRFFFAEFSEYWRILKPGGRFYGTVPSLTSPWLFGDPSHTRVITQDTLVFLSQEQYNTQVGRTSMSDFRHVYQADFELLGVDVGENSMAFVLRAVK